MEEMFFPTGSFDIRKGETIRYVVTNAGEFVHEFNNRTSEMHHAHADGWLTAMLWRVQWA